MDDPIFADGRDRSNANFLWFVKFERSFRETEQELQSPETSTSEAVLDSGKDFHNYMPIQDQNHEQELSAQIVALYQDDTGAGSGDKSGRHGGLLSQKPEKIQYQGDEGSNIVYLRNWPGQ